MANISKALEKNLAILESAKGENLSELHFQVRYAKHYETTGVIFTHIQPVGNTEETLNLHNLDLSLVPQVIKKYTNEFELKNQLTIPLNKLF